MYPKCLALYLCSYFNFAPTPRRLSSLWITPRPFCSSPWNISPSFPAPTNLLFPFIFYFCRACFIPFDGWCFDWLCVWVICVYVCTGCFQHTGCLSVCLQAADMWSDFGTGCYERDRTGEKGDEVWQLAGVQTERLRVTVRGNYSFDDKFEKF